MLLYVSYGEKWRKILLFMWIHRRWLRVHHLFHKSKNITTLQFSINMPKKIFNTFNLNISMARATVTTNGNVNLVLVVNRLVFLPHVRSLFQISVSLHHAFNHGFVKFAVCICCNSYREFCIVCSLYQSLHVTMDSQEPSYDLMSERRRLTLNIDNSVRQNIRNHKPTEEIIE